MVLFKSDFANFEQCKKKLYLAKMLPSSSRNNLSSYPAEVGNIVGNRAKDWAKEFISSPSPDSWFEVQRKTGINATELTRERLELETPLLFESSFFHNDVYCKTDLLWYLNGKHTVGEVKSSISIDGQVDAQKKYGLDLAVQYYAMTSAIEEKLINLEGFQLVVPDRESSTVGIDGLTFKRIEMMDYVASKSSEIEDSANEMRKILAEPYEPEINMGKQCKKGCPFLKHCRDQSYDLLAFELPGFNSQWRKHPTLHKPDYPLEMQTAVKDIPKDLLTLPVFKRVQESEMTLQPILDKEEARKLLSKHEGPYGYMDFEYTSLPYIPSEGMILGKTIPFQYVLYKRETDASSNGKPYHFLDLENKDPRSHFAKSLINDCKGLKTIFVYNKGAEGGIIEGLMKDFPELAGELKGIKDKFCDLLDVVRSTYYHPDILGSYSLKNILPTIGITYSDLNIQMGGDAQLQYLNVMHRREPLKETIEKIKQDLKEYCGKDTEGLIYLHKFLLSESTAETPTPIIERGEKLMKDSSSNNSSSINTKAIGNSKAKKYRLQTSTILWIVSIILIIWVFFSPTLYHFYGQPNNVAELGDSFNVVSSLFSALGLAGIVISMIIQQNELRSTRDDVEKSSRAQMQSAKTMLTSARIQALSVLIESANQQINQNDRWNDKNNSGKNAGSEVKYKNEQLFKKRKQAEVLLWKLKEHLDQENMTNELEENWDSEKD